MDTYKNIVDHLGDKAKILVQDVIEDENLIKFYNVIYTNCETICKQSDIISLHVPLTSSTKHLIDANIFH